MKGSKARKREWDEWIITRQPTYLGDKRKNRTDELIMGARYKVRRKQVCLYNDEPFFFEIVHDGDDGLTRRRKRTEHK